MNYEYNEIRKTEVIVIKQYIWQANIFKWINKIFIASWRINEAIIGNTKITETKIWFADAPSEWNFTINTSNKLKKYILLDRFYFKNR